MCSNTFYPRHLLSDMDLKDVKMLIDQASTWNPKPLIQLSLIGEPTLYPKLVEGVQYATNKGLKSRIYTNGQLLTRQLMKDLLSAGLTTFSATIDAVTKETYETIRPGLTFETVKQNFLDAWDLCKNSKTRMCVGAVITEENRHEVNQVKEFWTIRSHNFFFNPEVGGIDPRGNKPGRVGPIFPRGIYKHYSGCLAWTPWTQIAVRTNGDIPMCTKMYRWGCDPYMGNAFTSEKPLLEIYNSAEWNDYRRKVQNLVDLPYQCKLLCHGFGGTN